MMNGWTPMGKLLRYWYSANYGVAPTINGECTATAVLASATVEVKRVYAPTQNGSTPSPGVAGDVPKAYENASPRRVWGRRPGAT